ncbi:MAG: DUF3379 family protein [Gammaproteobacteria bacterium]
MNCQTFAQQLGADPGHIDESMRDHASSCATCAALQAELTQFDSLLRSALDVDVPAGLGVLVDDTLATTAADSLTESATDTVTTDNVVPLRKAATGDERRWNTPMYALAATLLLGIGAFFGNLLSQETSQLPLEVVAHIDHEPNLLVGDWSVVPASQLNTVLTSGRVSLKGDIGTVRHAGLCSFRGNNVAHVVVQSSNGPVTVMLLPEEKTDGITSFNEEGYRGVLIPVGEGSIAVISDSEASTNEVRQNVTDKVAWSI